MVTYIFYVFEKNIVMDNRIIVKELKNSIRGKHPVFSDALKEGYHA